MGWPERLHLSPISWLPTVGMPAYKGHSVPTVLVRRRGPLPGSLHLGEIVTTPRSHVVPDDLANTSGTLLVFFHFLAIAEEEIIATESQFNDFGAQLSEPCHNRKSHLGAERNLACL
jgi:hypothetical protein